MDKCMDSIPMKNLNYIILYTIFKLKHNYYVWVMNKIVMNIEIKGATH